MSKITIILVFVAIVCCAQAAPAANFPFGANPSDMMAQMQAHLQGLMNSPAKIADNFKNQHSDGVVAYGSSSMVNGKPSHEAFVGEMVDGKYKEFKTQN